MWRHLAVGGLDHAKVRLHKGVTILRKHRDGKGRWRRFPFYYTLFALTGIDLPIAKAEMRYAANVCERLLNRQSMQDKYGRRRLRLLETVLQHT